VKKYIKERYQRKKLGRKKKEKKEGRGRRKYKNKEGRNEGTKDKQTCERIKDKGMY
jgi:hypothetical protein